METINTMETITLKTLRSYTVWHWEDTAKWWTRVLDTDTLQPLWEFRRGYDFFFETQEKQPRPRTDLPRMGWSAFLRLPVGGVRKLLVEQKVLILTVRKAPVFLVRLPE